jgi:hypothetical protein
MAESIILDDFDGLRDYSPDDRAAFEQGDL